MRKKRLLKIAAISIVVLIALLMLFVTAFIYNPTEGSLPDVRGVVPRNVDFFVRKTNLAEDFGEFPEPVFWAEFEQSSSWRQLRGGAMTRDLEQSVASAVEDLRGVAEEIRAQSSGHLDLLRDLLGEEVVIAGRFEPPTFDRAKFCAYLRVSWRVRVLWGLLGWQSVQNMVVEGGVGLAANDDGTFTVVQGQDTFHLARHLDCLMVANDRELLDGSIALAEGLETDAFGDSASYRDGIEGRLRDWEDFQGVAANAVEIYTRPDQLFALTRWDDNWPNPRHENDMNERVLASFINLESWRFLTGSLILENEFLTMQARVELNRNKHTGFQNEFYRAESAPRDSWLTPFLQMVPEGVNSRGACAAAAIRVDAGDFLSEMFYALDDHALIDDMLRATGKYTGGQDLINKLRPVLLPRIGFVFMRSRELPIKVFEPSPAPHVAWMFWIREEGRNLLDELREFLTVNRNQLGFESVTDLPLPGLSQPCRGFQNPNIPGTGEIALLIYGDFFILTNSSDLARDMMEARLQSKSLIQDGTWKELERELSSNLNGFVYLNGERLSNVFGDYVRHVGEASREPDPGWMLSNRPRIEKVVLEQKFSRYRSVASIPPAEQEAFDAAVDAEMESEWSRQRSSFTAGDRERYEQLRIACKMLDAGYVQLELDPQFIQLQAALKLYPYQ